MATKHEQLEMIRIIEAEISALGDYLYVENDIHINKTIERLEKQLASLKNTFYDEQTYICLRDRETGEKHYRYFEEGDVGSLCHYAAQHYAWSDCDDTYAIEMIMCAGIKLEYVGWQPCMLYEFREVESGEIVFSREYPQWDH